MSIPAIVYTAIGVWLGIIFLWMLDAWRQRYIDNFYEKHGHDSTHWWCWPDNSGLPLKDQK